MRWEGASVSCATPSPLTVRLFVERAGACVLCHVIVTFTVSVHVCMYVKRGGPFVLCYNALLPVCICVFHTRACMHAVNVDLKAGFCMCVCFTHVLACMLSMLS